MGAGGLASLAGCQGGQSDGGSAGDGDASTGDASTGDASTGGDSRGTYVEAVPSDAQSLNFLYQSDANSEKFVGAAMDAAYDFRDFGEIVPLWIESVTETDKTVWEYTLRDNLRWSEPYGQLTAEDWVYTVRNLYQGEGNWAGVVQYASWPDDVTIEETGERSFRVTLPEPQPAFLASRAMWGARCLPKGLIEPYVEERDVEGLKRDEELNTLSYTGNLGPYDFEEWERESRFVATRADEYYLREVAGEEPFGEAFAEAPYFDEYRLQVIPEESTRLQALREGDLTFYQNVPADKVAQYRELDHLKFRFPPNPYCASLYYNQRANGWELLRDVRVRRALSTAIDKVAVAEDIYRGFPTVAQTFQPEWSPWYVTERVTEHGAGDTHSYEEARSLLESAVSGTDYGYDGDALVGPDGSQVTLRLVFRAGASQNQTTAEFVAQELSNVGIAVDPVNGGPANTVQSKYLLNTDGEGQPTFNGGSRDASTSQEPWDLLYGITLNAYPINPNGSEVFWTESGSFNFFGYVPEAPLADWYATAKSTTDEAARREAFAKVFAALSEEQPVDFLNFSVFKNAYRRDYVGMPDEGEYDYLDGWDSTTWRLAEG